MINILITMIMMCVSPR